MAFIFSALARLPFPASRLRGWGGRRQKGAEKLTPRRPGGETEARHGQELNLAKCNRERLRFLAASPGLLSSPTPLQCYLLFC